MKTPSLEDILEKASNGAVPKVESAMGEGAAALSDDSDVGIFYHYSCDDIDRFNGLTHFGTVEAANDRMQGVGKSGGRIYACVLDIKNPLEMHDANDRDLVFNEYALKKAGVDSKTIKWIHQPENPVRFPKLQSSLSFLSGQVFGAMSVEQVKEELCREGIFDLDDPYISKSRELERQESSVGKPYEDRIRFRLSAQRFILSLEKLGYDGLVYVNRREGKGSKSYCIFRPEQVSNAFDLSSENKMGRSVEGDVALEEGFELSDENKHLEDLEIGV